LARLLNVPTFVIFRCFFQYAGFSAETGANTGKQGRAATSAGTPIFHPLAKTAQKGRTDAQNGL